MPAKWKDLLGGLPGAIEEAIDSAYRDAAEALNQAVRRIAQSSTVPDVLAALVDSSSAFSAVATVLSLNDGQASMVRSRGTGAQGQAFAISTSPALGSLLESKEPVASAATTDQLSANLAEVLASPNGTAYLFPLKVRQEVVAALAATGTVHAGAMECLSEAASLKLEILLPPPPPSPPASAPAPTPAAQKEAKREPSAWDALPAEAQRLHLQAQRFARVKVAELRLYQAERVREGRSRSDLYGALHEEIDKLRRDYLKDFGSTSSMVDYLHLEVIRTLAHDDERLLGPNYPGQLF